MTEINHHDLKAALQDVLTKTALDIFGMTGAAAFRLKIPNTSPPLYIVVGAEEDIKNLIE
jgi:hypothetical protein